MPYNRVTHSPLLPDTHRLVRTLWGSASPGLPEASHSSYSAHGASLPFRWRGPQRYWGCPISWHQAPVATRWKWRYNCNLYRQCISQGLYPLCLFWNGWKMRACGPVIYSWEIHWQLYPMPCVYVLYVFLIRILPNFVIRQNYILLWNIIAIVLSSF